MEYIVPKHLNIDVVPNNNTKVVDEYNVNTLVEVATDPFDVLSEEEIAELLREAKEETDKAIETTINNPGNYLVDVLGFDEELVEYIKSLWD